MQEKITKEEKIAEEHFKEIISEQYEKWIIKNWQECGGLITPGMTAKMLNVSMTRINQIWKEKNFEKLVNPWDKNKSLLKYTDVIKLINERKEKKNCAVFNDEFYNLEIKAIHQTKKSFTYDNEELKKALQIIEYAKETLEYQIKQNNDSQFFNNPPKGLKNQENN